jgi:hypothetical protein
LLSASAGASVRCPTYEPGPPYPAVAASSRCVRMSTRGDRYIRSVKANYELCNEAAGLPPLGRQRPRQQASKQHRHALERRCAGSRSRFRSLHLTCAHGTVRHSHSAQTPKPSCRCARMAHGQAHRCSQQTSFPLFHRGNSRVRHFTRR